MATEDNLTRMATKYFKNKYRKDKSKSHWKPNPNELHVSDAGKCPRQTYYKHKIGVKEPSLNSCRNFERGNITEQYAENVLENAYGKRCVVNSIITREQLNGFSLVGETDIVILSTNGVIKDLWEIKSKAHYNFKWIKEEPAKNHLYQVHGYMHSLGLDECNIWYIQLPNFTDVIHRVYFDYDIWKDIVTTLTDLNNSINKGICPSAEPFEKWECDERFCPYYDICERDKEESKDEES